MVIIVSWNRPQFLKRTLDSLFDRLAEVHSQVIVVDNGSNAETVAVIESERRLSRFLLLPSNVGINAALETILPVDITEVCDAILVSDADMEYRMPLADVLPLLVAQPKIGGLSLQHSPEHAIVEESVINNRPILLKQVERGCALLFLAARFQQFRPLPVHKLIDFDWWVMRDAPQSLLALDQVVAVLPGAAVHMGWRQGDSTWQTIETPEFDEYRV